MTDAQKLARIFKALSVDTRVRMVQLLKNHALCVGALSARLDITQGAVSQHLRILRDAGLVTPEKRGYYVHYRLNERTLLKWRSSVQRFLGIEGENRALSGPENPIQKGGKPCVRRKRDVRGQRN